MTFRRGVRLAVDWGDVRIGVAACDADGVLAYPLTTVRAGADEVADLAGLVAEHAPVEVLVGLPRSLHGGEGPAAAIARERAGRRTSRRWWWSPPRAPGTGACGPVT